jgi:hypothetical protein
LVLVLVTIAVLICAGFAGADDATPPTVTPPNGDVYVGATLSPGFGMGIATGGNAQNWVTDDHKGTMECAYPAGQGWGALFITAGAPLRNIALRHTLNYSGYTSLVLDLKGAQGGETISIGVKTATDPDNGQEPKHWVKGLTADWQTVSIPLRELVDAPDGYPADRFGSLYVVCELVFGTPAETIYFRNVHYEK